MIWESGYWKDDLLRVAARLRRRQQQRRWPQVSLANVEKDLFLGFYAVRKLIDAGKLSDSTVAMTIAVAVHPRMGRAITKMNRHHLDELYDINTSVPGVLGLRELCNQFVHSYAFSTFHREDEGLDAVLVASDREKSVRLFKVSLVDVLTVFERVGHDYPNQCNMFLNPKTGDYETHQEMVSEGWEQSESSGGAEA